MKFSCDWESLLRGETDHKKEISSLGNLTFENLFHDK